MIVDGRLLSQKIEDSLKSRVANFEREVKLAVVIVGNDPVSLKYINRKKIIGERIGVKVDIFEYEDSISQVELEQEISRLNNSKEIDGLIVQLPLPENLNREAILNLISKEKDVDSLSENAVVLSPVIRAVDEVFKFGQVELTGKKIVVVGQGKLVGRPIAIWLASGGFDVTVLDSAVTNLADITKQADVLILGVGKSNLIKPDMIKSGVVIVDAATSEVGGKLVGDADPACTDKASLFTPVPGGVGPITLVMLFANLIDLAESN